MEFHFIKLTLPGEKKCVKEYIKKKYHASGKPRLCRLRRKADI